MSRGDRREDIFLDDVDRQDFLKTLAEACQKTGFQVHAYCLMRNHFHLVIETPNANLVAGMAWLLSAYTIRLNHWHKLFGHVFAGRYKAQAVDGSGGGYLRDDAPDAGQGARGWLEYFSITAEILTGQPPACLLSSAACIKA
jgi:REP element-mobilizing transposase RayT